MTTLSSHTSADAESSETAARDTADTGPSDAADLARSRRFRISALASIVFVCAAFAVLAWSRRWISDDGFINLTVVDNLLSGDGPVFNAGERVEVGTSTVWIYLLAVVGGIFRFMALEWVAVLLGIALAVAGIGMAMLASLRLSGFESRPGWVVPAGVLVVVALPPFWDFASSGLELGVTLAWLGASFLALVTLRAPVLTAVLIGLGPLVRPDLALYTLGFLAVLAMLQWHLRWRRLAILGVAAFGLPVAYEIFRMGYYAALVPNTAIAKEASAAWWSQGWLYLVDFVAPYVLVVPLAILAGAGGYTAWRTLARPREAVSASTDASPPRDWTGMVLVLAPIACAVAQGIYVVRVGGDFMHARMFLPPLFALTLPVAALVVRAWSQVATAGALAVWALALVFVVGPPEDNTTIDAAGIVDERAFYSEAKDHAHPVTPEDHLGVVLEDTIADDRARTGRLSAPPAGTLPLDADVSARHVWARPVIGVYAYVLGDDTRIVDLIGLADPINARFALGDRSELRPGHAKTADGAWIIARFADLDALEAAAVPLDPEVTSGIETAARALECDRLAALDAAVSEPLTVSRFVENITLAPRLHGMRIPADPEAAEDRFCA